MLLMRSRMASSARAYAAPLPITTNGVFATLPAHAILCSLNSSIAAFGGLGIRTAAGSP